MRRVLVVVALSVGVSLAAIPPAIALFTAVATTNQDLGTATLPPPSSPHAGAGECSTTDGDTIVLTWDATTASWSDGYEVLRSTTSGGPYEILATISGRETTSYTNTGLPHEQEYVYVLRSTSSGWTSALTSEVSAITRTPDCA